LKIILDASTIINLISGDILEPTLSIEQNEYIIGSIVFGELSQKTQETLDRYSGLWQREDGRNISGSIYGNLLTTYKLGKGETECLAYCSDNIETVIATDDLKARSVAESLYGANRLTGTIGLMRSLVKKKSFSDVDAENSYQKMLQCGSFLPVGLTAKDFS